ncbi:cell division protein FtsQ/DivIB [Psychroserpens algicola]|uniref:Cell division protein FtsQ/DivIB n=1 Tax=Psychroserpens algicola TaxID=1719034 RepID=A0ABT0H833_9FLAO|nr:cell division protein FtsQ/DivIB [Psychroserpens algicola]MCK8480524.1 cell division protein FtsQ/DivIB [Psychroserpens algicola]
MRVNYNYIKVGLLLVLVSFLYAFSSVRNSERKVAAPDIKFIGDDHLFVTHETVSKLLIQNQETVTNKPKDIIDLNGLESALNSNPMIKQAQVFMSVDGLITAEIEQKKPIARVSTNASYYIDEAGSFMPLSTNYTARVPLVTGNIDKNDLANVHEIATKVQADEFLLKHVVEIHQNQDKTIDLKFRSHDFNVHLGTLQLLDKKINNLKAFYKKAMKDKTLDTYELVNLKFDKQVICTKK